MVDYLQDFAARHRLRVQYETDVLSVTRGEEGEDFVVETTRGTWTADRVIVATGLAADNVPAIPGVEHAESYRDMPTDPADFRGQRVLIVGKGNSAFETAHNLIETAAALHLVSPNPVRMAWRTRFVGDLRAVNNDLLDTYGLKSQNTVLDANVEEIRPRSGGLNVRLQYTRAQGQRVELEVDRVIRCTGLPIRHQHLQGVGSRACSRRALARRSRLGGNLRTCLTSSLSARSCRHVTTDEPFPPSYMAFGTTLRPSSICYGSGTTASRDLGGR